MSAPEIEDYRFGHITVDGQSHDDDVIILPNHVVGGWWRKEGHALHPVDLELVLEARPDVLIVGQGASGRMRVSQETRERLEEAGIEVITLNTDDACRIYNQRRDEGEVAAALHLTC